MVEPVFAKRSERGVRLGRQLRRQPGRRLVEHQHPRVGHQRPPDGEHLLLAAAHRAGALADALAEAGEQLEHERPPLGVGPPRVGAEVEVLAHRHLGEQATLGGHVGDARVGRCRGRGDR